MRFYSFFFNFLVFISNFLVAIKNIEFIASQKLFEEKNANYNVLKKLKDIFFSESDIILKQLF